jgi:hypothetical protein
MDMATGMGAGFAIGIAAGIGAGKKQVEQNLQKLFMEEGYRVQNGAGEMVAVDEFIQYAVKTSTDKKAQKIAMILVALGIVALVAGLVFYFRF